MEDEGYHGYTGRLHAVRGRRGRAALGFIADPSVRCLVPHPAGSFFKLRFTREIVGEQYLPMASDLFRQPEGKLRFQYILPLKNRLFWRLNYGGSCDNHVHEYFKCLDETVFGKAFIHFGILSDSERQIIVKGKTIHARPGFQTIDVDTCAEP